MNETGEAGRPALVLGGGGPVGVGWECGLLTGFLGAGIPLDHAGRIIGTSAGAVVGASLALGESLDALVEASTLPLPLPAGLPVDVTDLAAALGGALARQPSAEAARAEVAQYYATAVTVAEQDYLDTRFFSAFYDHPWPASLTITAIEVDSGSLVSFDHSSAVALSRALAASCAVPGIFPYVRIAGRQHMDGGLRTPLNADLAAGSTSVLVVSCYALDLDTTDSVDPVTAQQMEDCKSVRRGGARLELISPNQEFLEVSGWGADLMDTTKVGVAHEIGQRQAAAEAARIKTLWF